MNENEISNIQFIVFENVSFWSTTIGHSHPVAGGCTLLLKCRGKDFFINNLFIIQYINLRDDIINSKHSEAQFGVLLNYKP